MKNSPMNLLVVPALLFLIATGANAAEAEKSYQFQPSPTCPLQKRMNMDWVKADPAEIAKTGPFMLHETFNHPELSTFYANHDAYSAPTQCFVAVGEPKVEPESATEKAEEKKEEKKEEEIEEETESEFLHQARYQIFEVTPAVGYLSSSADFKNFSLNSAKTSGITTGALVEYGILEHISIGANVNYDHFSFSTTPSGGTTPTVSGLEDPKFFVNAKTELGDSEIRLNLLFNTAFSHPTTQVNGDSNVASGSFVFTPALGYEYHLGHDIFGAQLAYDAVKSDSKHDTLSAPGPIATITVSGGKTFVGSLFYEHRLHTGEFGISVQYAKVNHTAEDGVDLDNGGSIWLATAYGEIEFNEKISLLPSVVFSRADFEQDLDNSNVDHVINISGALGARFKF